MNELFCESAKEWRAWLKENHAKSDEIWLVFFKKGMGDQTLTFDDALDEGLCFGWIDSLIKKLDEKRYAQRFTPRKPVSKWSPSNKARIERLMEERRMTKAGMALVDAAKANGCWDKPDRPPEVTEVPAELQALLARNAAARGNFQKLPPSHRRQYIMWIATAKRPETRQKRAAEAAGLLEKNEKLGLR